MKKIFCVLLLLLSGCTPRVQYYLYVYYAKTCPICESFIDYVIPELEEVYGSSMKITLLDIDEESSRESYAKTCSLLEDYYIDENSGNVPFIVLDGYFAKIGYDSSQQQDIIQAIDEAIQGKEITVQMSDLYYFQDGKTFR